eukprot:55294-Amphidinium_carterae.1
MAFALGRVHCAHISGDSSTHQRRVPVDLSLLHCWLCNSVLPAFGQGDLQKFQGFNAQCCNRRHCQTHWRWWQCWVNRAFKRSARGAWTNAELEQKPAVLHNAWAHWKLSNVDF